MRSNLIQHVCPKPSRSSLSSCLPMKETWYLIHLAGRMSPAPSQNRSEGDGSQSKPKKNMLASPLGVLNCRNKIARVLHASCKNPNSQIKFLHVRILRFVLVTVRPTGDMCKWPCQGQHYVTAVSRTPKGERKRSE